MKDEMDLFEERKRSHIQWALTSQSQSLPLSRDKEDFKTELLHEALPEIDFDDITLEIESLGNKKRTPFFVSSMTGGHKESPLLNKVLAESCFQRGWDLAIGSQRRELTDSTAALEWTQIQDQYPELHLYGNLGLAQVIQTPLSSLIQLIVRSGCRGFFVHLNPLQEVLQKEGTPQFKGGIEALSKLCLESPVPIFLKETGCGFSLSTLRKIQSLPLAVVDIAGRGGTHWGLIEGLRSLDKDEEKWRFEVAQNYSDWGLTTQHVLESLRGQEWPFEIWASGGIKNGKQAAHMLALGANRVGFAVEALKRALEGSDLLVKWMKRIEFELRVALFCTGSLRVEMLKKALKEKVL